MKPTRKYKPQYAQSRDWKDIESWYLELVDYGHDMLPMVYLITYIRSTDLKNRLFGYTSMHKLVVSIYEKIEWNKEALHIEFDIETRKWFFKYHPKPYAPIEFERTYSEKQGVEKFQNIIDMLKW